MNSLFARVQMPEVVSEWSWVGFIVEWGSVIVEGFLPRVEGKVTKTQQQAPCFVFSHYSSHLGVGQQTQDIGFQLKFLFIV